MQNQTSTWQSDAPTVSERTENTKTNDRVAEFERPARSKIQSQPCIFGVPTTGIPSLCPCPRPPAGSNGSLMLVRSRVRPARHPASCTTTALRSAGGYRPGRVPARGAGDPRTGTGHGWWLPIRSWPPARHHVARGRNGIGTAQCARLAMESKVAGEECVMFRQAA